MAKRRGGGGAGARMTQRNPVRSNWQQSESIPRASAPMPPAVPGGPSSAEMAAVQLGPLPANADANTAYRWVYRAEAINSHASAGGGPFQPFSQGEIMSAMTKAMGTTLTEADVA